MLPQRTQAGNNTADAVTHTAMRPIPSALRTPVHYPRVIESEPPGAGPVADPDRRPPCGAVTHGQYARQAAWITFGSFSLPTIASPWFRSLLSPQAYALRTLLAGTLYVDMIQPPLRVRFSPPPTRLQELIALTLGMGPYIAVFTLQAHLTNTWCARDDTVGARMAAASQRCWTRSCGSLPQPYAAAARGYPINFVLARVIAQMASVSIGSTLSAAWHRYRGATLEAIPQPPRLPSMRERIQVYPQAYFAGMLAFAWPAFLTWRLDRAAAATGKVSPAGVALLTTAVVSACIVTSMVHPAQEAQPGQ
jgi:hypothetical protein